MDTVFDFSYVSVANKLISSYFMSIFFIDSQYNQEWEVIIEDVV